jgi:hypothetical protein
MQGAQQELFIRVLQSWGSARELLKQEYYQKYGSFGSAATPAPSEKTMPPPPNRTAAEVKAAREAAEALRSLSNHRIM